MPKLGDFLPPPPWEGPGELWKRALIWGRHEEITRDLEAIAHLIISLRERLPRYLELIGPYAEEGEVEELRELLKPHFSTEDLVDALEILHEIEFRGI